MFYFIQGQKLPTTLEDHSSLSLGNDLIVLGGNTRNNGHDHYSAYVFKLSCHNEQFVWTKLDVQLQTPRAGFVASFTPN